MRANYPLIVYLPARASEDPVKASAPTCSGVGCGSCLDQAQKSAGHRWGELTTREACGGWSWRVEGDQSARSGALEGPEPFLRLLPEERSQGVCAPDVCVQASRRARRQRRFAIVTPRGRALSEYCDAIHAVS